MQNILNFKDDSMGYIPRIRQVFNWKRKRNSSSTNALFLSYYKISKDSNF